MDIGRGDEKEYRAGEMWSIYGALSLPHESTFVVA
jgi:hypothetical protein